MGMSLLSFIHIGLMLLCFICETFSRGLIVIPGLGRADRLQTVVYNLKLLESKYINGSKQFKWDCIVYIYAPRTETSFWSETKEIEYIYSLCKVIENPNKRFTENLFMLQPALIKASYQRVFILLDDCKLSATFALG